MPKKYRLPVKKKPAFSAKGYPIMLEIDALGLSAAEFREFVAEVAEELPWIILQYKRQKKYNTQVLQVRCSHGSAIETRALIFGPA